MNEALLVFLWKYRVLGNHFVTTDGEDVQVYHPGTENNHGGPDFINARMKIGDLLWAGNVEIHWRSSDWFRHEHDKDAAYDSVVLHVSMYHDTEVFTASGRKLNALDLNTRDLGAIIERYRFLNLSHDPVPCLVIPNLERIKLTGPWLTRLAVERLEKKAGALAQQWIWEEGQWDRVFLLQLFRSYGLPANAEPFLRLARKFMLVRDQFGLDPDDYEAILLYLAGFIPGPSPDAYTVRLTERAVRLVNGIPVMPRAAWKLLRMRPGGFPGLRIAQLAAGLTAIIQLNHNQRIEMEVAGWKTLLSMPAAPYWDHHFLPGVPTQRAWPKKPGSSFVDAIIINAVVPYLATVAHCSNEHALMSRALAMLESCPAEDNRIIRLWTAAGIQPANAAESQGMMELYQSYCSRHRCLQCRIGYLLLHQQE